MPVWGAPSSSSRRASGAVRSAWRPVLRRRPARWRGTRWCPVRRALSARCRCWWRRSKCATTSWLVSGLPRQCRACRRRQRAGGRARWWSRRTRPSRSAPRHRPRLASRSGCRPRCRCGIRRGTVRRPSARDRSARGLPPQRPDPGAPPDDIDELAFRPLQGASGLPADRQQRCQHRPLGIGQITADDSRYRFHEFSVR